MRAVVGCKPDFIVEIKDSLGGRKQGNLRDPAGTLQSVGLLVTT